MKAAQLATLRLFTLAFLLPGLAGLILSAMMSVHYLDTMPRWPDLDNNRVVPRGIHGITVYQTPQEDRRLNLMEYSSVGVFGAGLVLSVVYLEKWSSLQGREEEDEPGLAQHPG